MFLGWPLGGISVVKSLPFVQPYLFHNTEEPVFKTVMEMSRHKKNKRMKNNIIIAAVWWKTGLLLLLKQTKF